MIRAALRRFGLDDRGIAATEFAMTAPLLILFYFGLCEVSSAYMAQKRASHATSMIADLVAQEQEMTTDNLSKILDIGGLIMKPFDSALLTTRVTQVTQDSKGVAKVDWSWGRGMTAYKDGATITLPAGLLENGQSVVMSETAYAYQSPVGDRLPGITNFKSSYYLRPRAIDKIPCTNCPKNP